MTKARGVSQRYAPKRGAGESAANGDEELIWVATEIELARQHGDDVQFASEDVA